jgi:hypothetical protein
MPSIIGNALPRRRPRRIHPPNTLRSSSRHASKVGAFAHTPGVLGISPYYVPSLSFSYSACRIAALMYSVNIAISSRGNAGERAAAATRN